MHKRCGRAIASSSSFRDAAFTLGDGAGGQAMGHTAFRDRCEPPDNGGVRMGDRLDVLVVDADAVTAEIVGVALEAIGARCEWVRDGRSALDRLNGVPADLVMLDLRLPRVGGMDVLRAMRR